MNGLSPAARAWAIERVLDHVEGRYVEKLARDAATDEEAVKAVRRDSAGSGYSAAFPRPERWSALYRHIEVTGPDGTEGVLSWLEVVRVARAETIQGVLL